MATSDVTQQRPKPPKYLIVREWLVQRICDGDMRPGSRLPSENDLVRKFGVSRVTVRSALDALRQSGMVESRQGLGYFVRGIVAEIDFRRLQGLGEVLVHSGVATTARLTYRAKLKADGAARRALNLPPGATVLALRRVRLVNAAPVCCEDRRLPAEVGRRMTDQDLTTDDIVTLLEGKLGVPITFGDVVMEIVEASAKVARALDLEPGAVVVRTEQISYDIDRKPVDFCIRHAVAGAFRYRSRIGRW